MRKTYLVAYDFPGSADKYTELFDELKKSPGWWHYIDGTWLLRTDDSANEIYKRLKPYLDDDINLLIIEVGTDRQAWLPKKAWGWLRKHLD